jgi:hypothetical protein
MLTRQQDVFPGSNAPSAHRADRTRQFPALSPSTVFRDPPAHTQGLARFGKTTRAKTS